MILLTKDFGHYVHFTGTLKEKLNNYSLNVVFSIGEKVKTEKDKLRRIG